MRVATAAHKGQKRKSGGDYISHPKEVARIVKQYKKSHNLDALIQAAYLHDTIEDTDTTYKDLVKQFGGLVAGMVKDLTSDKDAIEAMGKGEYMANKMAKMSSWSLVIKLADRLANVGDIDDRPAEFQKKYANQTKLAIDTLKRDRYLSKTHKKIISAIEDKIKEYVTESVDEKVEFETDKDLPNLRKPKKTTDYEFRKYISKLKGAKSRGRDYFKSNPRFEEGGAGEENIKEREMSDGEKAKLNRLKKKYEKGEMQKNMKDRYGNDSPFYATLTKMAMKKEAVSPAQQAAIAIAKKKSGKYDDEGKKINETDGAGEEGTEKLVKKYKKDTPSQMDERKSPYQKLRDFDKSRQAVGKKSMFNDKPTEFVRMKKPGTMTTMNVPSNEIDKYAKMGYKVIKENDAVNALKKDHNDEKERLKNKHDREMDTARLQDTRSKNANEAFEALIEEPCCDDCAEDEYGWAEETNFIAIDEAAAEYQGRKVKLNNPTRSDNPKKKTMVYVKNEKGNVVKVYFGDPNMSIKRDDPERRKNFRARHNCDNPGPKWKARYWSCKFWSKKPVSKLMKG